MKMIQNDKAVTEVIGFIYIFAIVILAMSLIFVMGYPALQSSMDETIFESTEQSFIILQTDMKMVAFDQVPVKSLAVQLQSSTISVTNNSNITIEINDGTDTIYGSGGIEFQKNDKVLTYEDGAVFKEYPSGTIMVSNPRIYTDRINGNNITTIGIVSVNGTSSIGGASIATVIMKWDNSSVNTGTNVNVSLTINSIYAPEWESYLNSTQHFTTNRTGSNLVAWRNNTMLIVGNHAVDVEII